MIPEILVRREAEAAALIGDPLFRNQWRDLCHRCPWATVFQDVPYVTRWYELYSEQYEPVLVLGRDGRGGLTGLFCLGVERRTGKLVVAGLPHSEYSAWLAPPETDDQFIESALDRLAERFPGCKLGFGFLPPGTPVSWLGPGRRWSRFCDSRPYSRPIMAVGDGSKIRESLQKKSNRQNLKQFEKLGHLEFQRIRRYEEIAADFDEMTDLHDFRMGALHRGMAFRADPLKKALLRSLYEVPDLLHTTVWRLDGKIISARIGFVHRKSGQVTLGYLVHSPFLAKHSPGRLHVYLLGLLLAEEGIPELDLTAGGDSYKERFATHHDEVHRLTVFFSGAERLAVAAQAAARRTAKRALGLISVTPDDIRRQIDRVRSVRHHLMGTRGGFVSSARRGRNLTVHHLDRARIVGDLPDRPVLRRDVLADLLRYEPSSDQAPSKEDFLRDAWVRLERGDHVYTCLEDGLLISHIWLLRLTGSAGEDHGELLVGFPPGSILLDGFFAHPGHRDQGLFRATVARILKDLASAGDPNHVVVIVQSDHLAARKVLAELGFVDQLPLAVREPVSSPEDLNATVGRPRPLESHKLSQPPCAKGS